MNRPQRNASHAILALGVGLFIAIGVWSSAKAGEKSRAKVLLIGVDAGEWDVLGPLLDQKRVPSFARLRDTGASGKLRSLEPLTKSPTIWASIATGKVPAKHGINDFTARRVVQQRTEARARGDSAATDEDGAPVTFNLWRARPIWDILGSLGRKVGMVGWWTTWPAQPVNGFWISDYVQYDLGVWGRRDKRRTYPKSLDSLTLALKRLPQSVSWAELFQFVPQIDTTKVTPRQEKLMHQLRWIYAGDMTFYAIAMHLYKTERPDFFTVYFRGIDAVSHSYWDLDLPGAITPPMTDEELSWIKNLIPNYYVFTDLMIGRFLNEAGPKTDVIVCSDHGYMGGGRGGKGVMAHKLDGIIFAAGPNIRKGANISGATVLDITPTVLALFGLPTAQDMDGRLIEEALLPRVTREVAKETRLQTYETARTKVASDEPLRSPVDDELRERLRSLGYIQ